MTFYKYTPKLIDGNIQNNKLDALLNQYLNF